MKKIIALTLCLICIFTFSPSYAYTFEKAENSDIDFLTTLKILNVAEDEELSGKVISRIELAEMFYNIIFCYNNAQSEYWNDVDFPDVPAEKKHIAATVFGMGVMRGYSDTVFAPYDTVTYAQAVKAIVSFLGYDLYAQNMGGYPSGYLSQAARLKILPDVNYPGDAPLTIDMVAAMFKKAVNVDLAIWNHATADGTAILDVLEGTSYLEYYCGISLTKGKVTGNYLTNINNGDKTSFFGVLLDGRKMEVVKSAEGIQDMLGYNVYVYYTEDGGVATALYYEVAKSNVLEIAAENIASVTSSSISYFEEGSDRVNTADFVLNAALIYNGTFEPSYEVSDLNPFKNDNLDGFLKLIDCDNNGDFETIVVTAYQTMVVSDFRNNKIYGMYDVSENPLDRVIDITNYEHININIRNITGERVSPESIKKGVVLNVCRDKGGNIKEIIASKDTMSGVIEEISYTGSKISAIKISGATFRTSNGLIVVDSEKKLAAGLAANVFFNCEAEIALIDVESKYTDGYKTGYLVDAGTLGGLEKTILCRIFDSEGSMYDYTLASKISLDGEAVAADDVFERLGKTGNRVKRQVLLYKTDLDDKFITSVILAKVLASDEDAFNGFYQYPGTQFYYSGGHKSFNNQYLVNSDTIAFGVPDEDERDDYDSYIMTALPSGEGNNIGDESNLKDILLYGNEKEALVANIAVINSKSGAGAMGLDKRPLFIISKISTAIDEKGETGTKIYGYYIEGTNVKEGGFFIDPKLFAQGHEEGLSTRYVSVSTRPFIDQSETMPEVGDIFKFTSFAETGKIETMNVEEIFQLYDYGTGKFFNKDGIGYCKDYSRQVNHYFGTVTYKNGTSIKVKLGEGEYKGFELSAGSYKFLEITKQASTGELSIRPSTVDCIMSESSHPGEGSKVLVFTRGVGIACIVLNY